MRVCSVLSVSDTEFPEGRSISIISIILTKKLVIIKNLLHDLILVLIVLICTVSLHHSKTRQQFKH